MSVGYSGTPLPRKLGAKPGQRWLVIDVPDDLGAEALTGSLPEVVHRRPATQTTYDVIVVFCPDAVRLTRRLASLPDRLTTAGALWIAWPKRASGVATDLDENGVRDQALAVGLVDVKVAAIDATWSGLKLVRRLRDRQPAPTQQGDAHG